VRNSAGDRLELRGEVARYGRTVGFATVEIRNVPGGKLVAIGRHTKAFPSGTCVSATRAEC